MGHRRHRQPTHRLQPKTDARRGLGFIDRNKSRPFFLYFATTIPHANNEAAKELGNGEEVPSLGLYENKPWPAPEKGYAAMITYLDTQVGAILQRLKQLGLERNTLVMFTSDNGPEFKEFAGYDTEFFRSADGYRGFKRDNYEGGIRMPLVARWPGSITPGGVSTHVGYFGDFLATATELAGIMKPPSAWTASVSRHVAGPRQPTVPPARLPLLGIRRRQRLHAGGLMGGRWKGIGQAREAGLELYDLAADPAESRNVARQHPDLAAKLAAYLATARENVPNWPLHDLPMAGTTGKNTGKPRIHIAPR